MPNRSPQGHISFSRVFGAIVGFIFLVFNLWSFRQNYLLKHSAVGVQGVVIRTSAVRHRGGMAFNVDYAFDAGNRHFEATGQLTSDAYLKLRPGGPIDIRYVSSEPSISETADMSHNKVSLILIGCFGLPISLFILGVNLRKERLPAQYAQRQNLELVEENSGIEEMSSGDMGKTAPVFPDKWIAQPLWDNCRAIEVRDVDDVIIQLRKKNFQIKAEPFSTLFFRMAIAVDPDGDVYIVHQRTL
jgi:hypothetical protein